MQVTWVGDAKSWHKRHPTASNRRRRGAWAVLPRDICRVLSVERIVACARPFGPSQTRTGLARCISLVHAHFAAAFVQRLGHGRLSRYRVKPETLSVQRRRFICLRHRFRTERMGPDAGRDPTHPRDAPVFGHATALAGLGRLGVARQRQRSRSCTDARLAAPTARVAGARAR